MKLVGVVQNIVINFFLLSTGLATSLDHLDSATYGKRVFSLKRYKGSEVELGLTGTFA